MFKSNDIAIGILSASFVYFGLCVGKFNAHKRVYEEKINQRMQQLNQRMQQLNQQIHKHDQQIQISSNMIVKIASNMIEIKKYDNIKFTSKYFDSKMN